jgi:uncharacterized protein (UPF0332 family)
MPEAADYLAKARDELNKARSLLDVMHYSDEAGRAAYLAGFHAAQAFVFAQTGKVAKSHSGLRSSFARLARDEPRIDRAHTRFLAQAYKVKETADYGIGPEAIVTAAEAQETIVAAANLVECIAEILA